MERDFQSTKPTPWSTVGPQHGSTRMFLNASLPCPAAKGTQGKLTSMQPRYHPAWVQGSAY